MGGVDLDRFHRAATEMNSSQKPAEEVLRRPRIYGRAHRPEDQRKVFSAKNKIMLRSLRYSKCQVWPSFRLTTEELVHTPTEHLLESY